MCIIAAKPEGLILNEDIVQNMWDNNDDGAGFMYAEDGNLVVQKGFMTFNDFLAAYEPHKERSMVLHFRIRTHGRTDGSMTHPFVVDESLAFAHNGIIHGFGDQEHSDTWYFNENIIKVLRQKVPSFLEVDAITDLLKTKIGSSKLVFMDNLGEITILNEQLGQFSSDRIWFSNGSWQSYEQTKVIPYQQSSMYDDWFKNKDQERGKITTVWDRRTKSYSNDYSRSTILGENLEMDDYIIFKYSSYNVPAYEDKKRNIEGTILDKVAQGTIAKVIAFNMDNSLDLYLLKERRVIRVSSPALLQKIETRATVQRPWGHMSMGKQLVVVDFDAKKAQVIDPVLDRMYEIWVRNLSITT